jgi:ribonucleoside-triphosphate reductase
MDSGRQSKTGIRRRCATCGPETQQPGKEPCEMAKCSMKTEVYSRVCGYHRPVSNWNQGKKEEFKDRKEFETADRVKTKVA